LASVVLRKKEEGRRKKEEGRRKKEEKQFNFLILPIPNSLFPNYHPEAL
jgi:hypothetical protein